MTTHRQQVKFWTLLVLFFLQLCGGDRLGLPDDINGGTGSADPENQLGTGVTEESDVMDNCTGAAGPRPINQVASPGRTAMATVDDVNGGFCGVEINTPGIWWW